MFNRNVSKFSVGDVSSLYERRMTEYFVRNKPKNIATLDLAAQKSMVLRLIDGLFHC